jgi:hypothetical protein
VYAQRNSSCSSPHRAVPPHTANPNPNPNTVLQAHKNMSACLSTMCTTNP